MTKHKHIIAPCLVGVIICLLISTLAGLVSAANSDEWYQTLIKPAYNPPSFVFGPVWTILYVMIGIAGGLAWTQRKKHPVLFLFFCLQLIFNFIWSFIFFELKSIDWALIDILLLWVSILLTLVMAYRYQSAVRYWLIPYFLWVSFATLLNYKLWALN